MIVPTSGPAARPRRLRNSPLLRDMVSETDLSLNHFIQPYFVHPQATTTEPIAGFTGISRWGIDSLSKRIEADMDRGIRKFLLFGYAEAQHKTPHAESAVDPKGVLPQAVRALKSRFGSDVLLATDVCLCPYTSHGHCGVLGSEREAEVVANDPSVEVLAQMAVTHAEAGVDIVAPSDMMDGRVARMRESLDARGFVNTAILAYTAKYNSAYYGPFREALASSPKPGSDRATYQMDFRNRTEALRELQLDLAEGADLVLVKPALAYLDIVQRVKSLSTVPVVAYSVSGEYEMVKRLAAAGLCDERRMTLENLTAIRRAGADVVISYSATEIAEKGWI